MQQCCCHNTGIVSLQTVLVNVDKVTCGRIRTRLSFEPIPATVDGVSLQFPIVIPIIFMAAVIFLLVVPLYAAPRDTGMGLIIVCSGIPVYIVGVAWKTKPVSFNKFVSECLPVARRPGNSA